MESNWITKTHDFVKKEFEKAEGGHDYLHTLRVLNNALVIAEKTPCNIELVHLTSLLHDVGDAKFHNGDETVGVELIRDHLIEIACDKDTIEKILFIVKNISFRNDDRSLENRPIELDIVQDADRLEAIGAIGIARCFNYGGFKNHPIFDPNIYPKLTLTKQEYKNLAAPTINHFYEKLLKLKSLMNTKEGLRIAEERHQFMLDFLQQFYSEVGFNPIGTPFDLLQFGK